MILSTIKSNPFYRPDYMLFDVYLDGKQLNHCVTADEENGTAEVYVTDLLGCVRFFGDKIETKLVYGTVKIVRKGEKN